MINLDVLGLDPDFKKIRIGHEAPGHWFPALAEGVLKKHQIEAEWQTGNDDTAVFLANDIAAIGLGENGLHQIGPRIHTPDDQYEALHYEALMKAADVIQDILTELAKKRDKLSN